MMKTREKNLAKLENYADLINDYLSGKISVLDFEQKYLEMFKHDETLWVGEEFKLLNDLFSDLDSFCYDSAIRSSEDLDEIQLRSSARATLGRLKELLETAS